MQPKEFIQQSGTLLVAPSHHVALCSRDCVRACGFNTHQGSCSQLLQESASGVGGRIQMVSGLKSRVTHLAVK